MAHARHATRLLLALLALLLAIAAPASAQGTGRSMDIDGSAISSAMGGASSAVFWSAEPNYWANPALLGYYHGLRYQGATSRLVPGLAADVHLWSNRATLAAYGLGIEMAGKPVEGMWGTKLDYGLSEMVDQNGNLIGVFRSGEEIRSWRAGLSLAEFLRSAWPESRPAAWGRHFDLAVGLAQKDVRIRLAPEVLGGAAGATTEDIGALARGSFDLGAEPGRERAPYRLDLSLAASVLNFNDAEFTFINEDQASPPSRMRRLGVAARFAVALPAAWNAGPRSSFEAAFLRGFEPLLSIGAAYDDEHVQAGSSSEGAYSVGHIGMEVAVLNVLSVRIGHVSDRLGEIVAGSWGVGLGIPIADVAGARYDYGRYPQSTELPDVTRYTASVFVDPLAIWRLRK